MAQHPSYSISPLFLAEGQSRLSPLDFSFLAKLCRWVGKSTTLEQHSRIGLTRYLYSKENSVCYTGFRPKHALSDPKDSVSFVDDFVNMIAPWEIARYCNTEIFWYFSRSLDFHHLDKECIAPFRLILFVTYSHCFKFIRGLNFNCQALETYKHLGPLTAF